MLKRAGIPHAVLNAKHHEQEARIVAQAGRRGAVTVSTNMAGRGTDIRLGPGVAELGGLFVIGTERHPSRRVDRQLRGRCSRQGDPGRSRFFISLEDDLMRNHASPDHMASLIEQSRKTSRVSPIGALVETAQRQVEQRDYKARKRVLEFDDVMNLQREIVYGYRNEVLAAGDTRRLVDDIIREIILQQTSGGDPAAPDHAVLLHWLQSDLAVHVTEAELADASGESLHTLLVEKLRDAYQARTGKIPSELRERMERRMILIAIDRHWQEHLEAMDELREGVYLRAQGQKDPLVEYKNEAYELFVTLMEEIKQEALHHLFRFAV
jgi:preprotein translocase subunit SecA